MARTGRTTAVKLWILLGMCMFFALPAEQGAAEPEKVVKWENLYTVTGLLVTDSGERWGTTETGVTICILDPEKYQIAAVETAGENPADLSEDAWGKQIDFREAEEIREHGFVIREKPDETESAAERKEQEISGTNADETCRKENTEKADGDKDSGVTGSRREEKISPVLFERFGIDGSAPECRLSLSDAPAGKTREGVLLYNHAGVHVSAAVEDDGSGIHRIICTAGNEETGETKTMVWNTDAGGAELLPEPGNAGDPGETAFWHLVRTMREQVYAAETMLIGDGEGNRLYLEIMAEDQAGRRSKTERLVYAVDRTSPSLTVAFDRNSCANGRFFSSPRTAVLTLSDQNADPSNTRILAYGENGAVPQIGKWEEAASADGRLWKASVAFPEEDTYHFSAETTDLAGWHTDGASPAEGTVSPSLFVQDWTAPEVRVFCSQESPGQGIFFRGPRTIRMCVQDASFSPELADFSVLAESPAGEQEIRPKSWMKGNDGEMYCEIPCGLEGNYRVHAEVKDLALNEGNLQITDTAEVFILDFSAEPPLFTGVAENQVYRGNAAPAFLVQEPNLAEWEILLTYVDESGQETDITDRFLANAAVDGEKLSGGGIQIPVLKKWDGRYRFWVAYTDLAGNESRAECRFVVNRFGTRFLFAGAGAPGTPFFLTGEPEAVTITATNPGEMFLDEGRLILYRDGAKMQNPLYKRKTSGGGSVWQTAVYCLDAENFAEDGVYRIVLGMPDTAGIYTESWLQEGGEVTFCTDRTLPAIVHLYVDRRKEDGERVVLTVSAFDAVGLKEAAIFCKGVLLGKKQWKSGVTSGQAVFSVPVSGDAVFIRIKDAAGNIQETEAFVFRDGKEGLEVRTADLAESGESGEQENARGTDPAEQGEKNILFMRRDTEGQDSGGKESVILSDLDGEKVPVTISGRAKETSGEKEEWPLCIFVTAAGAAILLYLFWWKNWRKNHPRKRHR